LTAGERIHHFYYVESGAVKMSHSSVDGRTVVLHIFFPRSYFSLITTTTDGLNQYDFSTMVPTTLRKVPESELLAFLKSDSEVLFESHQRMLKGINGLLTRIKQSSLTGASSQVASILLYFAQHFATKKTLKKAASAHFTLKITHQEIADWLGLSRENVSIQMKRLERLDLIRHLDHFIEIKDIKSQTEAEEPNS
jgi:CRP/FNR family transcriptional regulator